MKKHLIITTVALIVFSFACAGLEKLFGEAPASEEPALRIYAGVEPPALDPTLAEVGGPGGSCIPLLFSSLTEVDQDGNLAPGLAKSWETSEDGTSWTFHLREDISWVRRDPGTGKVEAVRLVTSGDLTYATQRIFQRLADAVSHGPQINVPHWLIPEIKGAQEFLSGSGSLDQLGVRAVDDRTLEIELIFPVEDFPLGRSIYAVPEELVEQYGERWTEPENIWTSGPYLMDSWEHDNKLILVKNPLHPSAADNPLERIEVVYSLQPEQALEMYKNGELDILPVQPEDLEGILQDPKLSQELYYGPRLRVVALLFNTAKPPFDNRHVLQAFLYSINREEIILTTFHSTKSCNIIKWSNPEFDQVVAYNPEVAKLECELSGWCADYPDENNWVLEMQVPEDAEKQAVSSILLANWKEYLGIEVELSNQEWKIYLYYVPPEPEAASHMYLGSYYQWGWAKTAYTKLSYSSGINQVEMFPLYMTYTDAYLVRVDRDLELIDSFAREFASFTPASEISCPEIPQPSADELAEQCMEVVMEAKQAFEEHNCDVWVPKSEDALRLATEALSIDNNNSLAYYCRGLGNYYLERLPQALSDLERAQELGGSGYEPQLKMWIPYIRELVEAPACSISPMQFFEGWQNGKPINPSSEYSGNDPYTIQVYWKLEKPCYSFCRVVWKKDKRTVCWHDYGGENPHEIKGYEGSLYSNDDNSLLAPGLWEVEYRCGDTVVGGAEAVIP